MTRRGYFNVATRLLFPTSLLFGGVEANRIATNSHPCARPLSPRRPDAARNNACFRARARVRGNGTRESYDRGRHAIAPMTLRANDESRRFGRRLAAARGKVYKSRKHVRARVTHALKAGTRASFASGFKRARKIKEKERGSMRERAKSQESLRSPRSNQRELTGGVKEGVS